MKYNYIIIIIVMSVYNIIYKIALIMMMMTWYQWYCRTNIKKCVNWIQWIITGYYEDEYSVIY